MAAVGAVDETAGWRDDDLRRSARASEIGGQCGDGLKWVEYAALAVVGERGHQAAHLVEEIGVAPIRRKGDVARAGAWRRDGERRIVGDEFPIRRQPIDEG